MIIDTLCGRVLVRGSLAQSNPMAWRRTVKFGRPWKMARGRRARRLAPPVPNIWLHARTGERLHWFVVERHGAELGASLRASSKPRCRDTGERGEGGSIASAACHAAWRPRRARPTNLPISTSLLGER
jgi:hypothetical protein